MENKPFIHTMKTPYGYYFFDVNTNQIVGVDEQVYKYLETMDSPPEPQVEKALTALKSQGYLSDKHPKKMIHSENDFLEYHLNENIEHITLQVTQECNFRCSYCNYTIGNQRSHSLQKMSLEMAIAVIDFYFTHSKNQKKAVIGFYGGEPLLEFDLIKNIVQYAEKIFEGKDILFAVTTNGSLFNTENINFLSKHNFTIMISIDGIPEIHDKSRKFAKTGEGTYHVIEKNLKRIKNENPALFEKFSFNAVIDPRNGYDELADMFNKDELFIGTSVRTAIMEDSFTIEKVTESDEYSVEKSIHEVKVYLSLLGKYPDHKVSAVMKSDIINTLKNKKMAMKKQKILPDNMSHNGPCIPGQKRLFITVNGNFIPCEKVNEISEAMCIGNIYDGFDYEKARKLLNVAQLTEERCINCWAVLHCTQCARICDNDGKLSSALKASMCKNTRRSAEESIRNLIMLKELKNDI
ncbi:MAG: Cys-rich peptide radical SAM maturase CcpM [Oscillospiraceae bacterium]|nr:Cys-rich peptide radical SAM maturase CcpM [Oscillospiraceae bacterium]